MVVIISDKEQAEYTSFIAGMVETLSGQDVKGIAVVALCGNENLTGYWNMNLRDKTTAETEIRYDTIDSFILANRERYANDD